MFQKMRQMVFDTEDSRVVMTRSQRNSEESDVHYNKQQAS